MPKAKLTTKQAIDALPYPAKGQTLWWDGGLSGFGVLVGARTKSFIVQTDVRGLSRRITIGRHGEISVFAARKLAEQLRGAMRGGVDPVEEERKVSANNMTLRDAWKLYEGYLTAKERSPRTGDGYWKTIDLYCRDWLDRPLVEITPQAALARHHRIGTHGKYAANATMRAIRAIWNRARRQHPGLGESPIGNVDFYVEKPRTDVIKVEDLPAWWAGVQAIENPVRRDLFSWFLFTGCRRGESQSMRWDQVDLDAGKVHFPVTKTDPFDLPLSDFLVDLLKGRRACEATRATFGDDCPWVFPASRAEIGHVAESRLHAKELALFPHPWTPHTLRHTWNTISQNKVPMPAVHSRLLQNHALTSNGDAHAGYNHPDLEDLRGSQQMITDYILKAIRAE